MGNCNISSCAGYFRNCDGCHSSTKSYIIECWNYEPKFGLQKGLELSSFIFTEICWYWIELSVTDIETQYPPFPYLEYNKILNWTRKHSSGMRTTRFCGSDSFISNYSIMILIDLSIINKYQKLLLKIGGLCACSTICDMT